MPGPEISVILPVRNEAAGIRGALERLRRTCDLLPTEIIVVDGQSADATAAIARESADCVLAAPKPGRGSQMHCGAEKASGGFLLFLHADTVLPENWQTVVRDHFMQDPKGAAAAAFRLKFDSDAWPFPLIAATANLRNRVTGLPYGDQALIVSRETYFRAGGFPDVPMMEEFLFVPRLKRYGKIRLFQEYAVTSARKYRRNGPFRNVLRNNILILLFYLGVSPRRISDWY